MPRARKSRPKLSKMAKLYNKLGDLAMEFSEAGEGRDGDCCQEYIYSAMDSIWYQVLSQEDRDLINNKWDLDKRARK